MTRTSPIELGHFGYARHRGGLDARRLGQLAKLRPQDQRRHRPQPSLTHDLANELTQINSSNTHVAEDGAGNMTKLPKPSSWSAHYDLSFDAWNRLVGVADTGATVAGYEYDGRNFRTIKRTYTGGSLSETRHF